MQECYIALVDCDSFFVSCEQALNPELANKAVCVLSNNDGCVVARSREAKLLGVKMGMPYFMAKKEFPEAIYLSGDHKTYKDFSRKIMSILRDFSPSVEVYSIDEAFVELSGLKKLYKSNYLQIAKNIRKRIKEEVGIDVSIGLSRSKVLSKLACEKAKPGVGNGVFVIGRGKIPKILKETKVGEIWGIGRNTSLLFNRWGVLKCDDLVKKSDEWLKMRVGKRGVEIKHELLGECIDRVKTNRRLPKSIQNTRSFPKSTSDLNYIKNDLNIHIHNSCTKLRHFGGKCKTVCVMLKTKDFVTSWEKINLETQTDFEIEISRAAVKLIERIYQKDVVYRSCGVTLEGLDFSEDSQLNLFANCSAKNYAKLSKALDNLEAKFGRNVVKTGYFNMDW